MIVKKKSDDFLIRLMIPNYRVITKKIFLNSSSTFI